MIEAMMQELTSQNWRDLARRGKLDFLFQGFRPLGDGLEQLFHEVAGCSEVLPRLINVYQVTSVNFWTSNEDPYFIIRRPPFADDELVRSWVVRHLSDMHQLATLTNPSVAARRSTATPRIEVVREVVDPRSHLESPQALFLEMINDGIFSSVPVESDFFLLDEAFYHIACDYLLRHYLLWPLYKSAIPLNDPFAAYYKLWTHGANPIWEENNVVRVSISSNHDIAGDRHP
jgi:hypothetical protein